MKIEEIFYLLACYETDEPYDRDGIDEPRLFHTKETVDSWLTLEHYGDCVNEPVTCMRCFAEHCLHKAKFICSHLEEGNEN